MAKDYCEVHDRRLPTEAEWGYGRAGSDRPRLGNLAEDTSTVDRRPIGSFQAIAHMLADMQTEVDAARLLSYRVAWMIDQSIPCMKEVSMAKLYASQTANFVCNEAVQIHGAYGYVKEYAVERYFRDARSTEIYEGTSEAQKMVIARTLMKENK